MFTRFAWRKWPIQTVLINVAWVGSFVTTAMYFPVFNRKQLLMLFLMSLLLVGSIDLIRASFRFANFVMRKWPMRGGAFVVGVMAALSTVFYAVKEHQPQPTVQFVENCIGLKPEALTKLIAHRGNRRLAPENTIPAIQKAKEEGFRYVEIDVFLSQDNQVIVTHGVNYTEPTVLDSYVPHLGTVEGPTIDCWGKNFETQPYDFIRNCDVARVHENEEYKKYAPAQVPLLEDVLASYGNNLTIFVELKATTIDDATRNTLLGTKVAQLQLTYVDDPDMRWVTSFNADCLRAVQAVSPQVHTMLNLIDYPLVVNDLVAIRPGKNGLVESALLAAKQSGVDAVNMDVYQLPLNMLDREMQLVAPGDYFRHYGVTLSTYSLAKTDDDVLARVAMLRPDFYMSDQVLQPGY
ncbi:MAG: glycerophosphodiester phosphodiesterase [Rhizobacter sp.]